MDHTASKFIHSNSQIQRMFDDDFKVRKSTSYWLRNKDSLIAAFNRTYKDKSNFIEWLNAFYQLYHGYSVMTAYMGNFTLEFIESRIIFLKVIKCRFKEFDFDVSQDSQCYEIWERDQIHKYRKYQKKINVNVEVIPLVWIPQNEETEWKSKNAFKCYQQRNTRIQTPPSSADDSF